MSGRLHFPKLVLLVQHFGDVLADRVKQELVLLLFDSGDGQFAEDLVDGLELPQLAHLPVGLVDHFLDQFVLLAQLLPAFLFNH